ncbi:MAG: hypothetical protein R3B47_09220 [Bacteroidia bacterium]
MFDKTNYICLHITSPEALQEGLMAWLSELGYEAFEQEDELLKAFIAEEHYQKMPL